MSDIGLHIDFEDWRESGLLSPVKSQGAGSTLDEEDDEEDEKGVTIVETLEWIRENGCVLENDCPYTQELEVVPPAPDQHRLVRMRIVTVKPIPRKRMEEHIQYNAPVIVETDWIDEMDDLHGDTIYSGPILASAFEKSTKHGVLVVGFGREMVGNEEV
ncbi:cathepsin B, partial [Trifolium medium]|nr:cathepsin B [Trifolium medium]